MPIHISDEISSLSAILLDDNYYKLLLDGKRIRNGLSILRPEYIILFKARAYLDLKKKNESGVYVNRDDIKKHKKDILRITAELMLEEVTDIPETVNHDVNEFIDSLANEPFDQNLLKEYGLNNNEVIENLKRIFM